MNESSQVVINWPIAILLSVLAVCATVLSALHVIPTDVVTHGLALLIGIFVPTEPIAKRYRIQYSVHPPPMTIESDRPDPTIPPPPRTRR